MLQDLGVPAQAGQTRKVPRILFKYRGTVPSRHKVKNPARAGERVMLDKKRFLNAATTLIMGQAMVEHGENRKHRREVNQAELAASAGYRSRTSLTRILTDFYADDVESPKRKRDRRHARIPLIQRSRKFAQTNSYRFNLPEGKNPKIEPQYYVSPSPEDLAVTPWAQVWDLSEKSIRGYKAIPRWVYDRRLNLSPLARRTMTFLMMCGLEDLGVVTPKLATIARAVGVTKKTARKALAAWEKISVLRVIGQQARRDPDGTWRQPPLRIIYLPKRTVSRDEARIEGERLLAARLRLRHDVEQAWWQQTFSMHTALLRAWTGSERLLKTFWRQCRIDMLAAAVPPAVIDQLIPRPPD